jgi:hypothetical protein
MKKLGTAAILALFVATPMWATHELCLKAGFVLNKGAGPFYSWILIQESNYYIQDFISFGYETQFSYYQEKDTAGTGTGFSAYPLNVFLNSKIKIVRKGFFRPYAGAGFGFFSSVKSYADHYGWDKALATQVMAGVSIGMGQRAAFQIEIKMLNTDSPGFKTKFILAGGISY